MNKLVIVYLSNSLIFSAVISAAFLPENSIDPYVGPILANPCVSVTDIPAATSPGYTSPVLLTTCSSPSFTYIGFIPFHSTSPLSTSRFTATESCPDASMIIFASSAIGSTHVMFLGNADTGIQLTTMPVTLPFFKTRSSNFVRLRNFTPASHAAAINFETACGPGVKYNPSETFLYGIPNSSHIFWAGSLTVTGFIMYPPNQ